MRAKGNTPHQCGRSAGWTGIRGLGKSEMKSLFLSQRMAGLPSGLSEKDLNVQVSFTVTFSCGSAKERFVSFHALEGSCRNVFIPHPSLKISVITHPALSFTLTPHPAKPMLGLRSLLAPRSSLFLSLLLTPKKIWARDYKFFQGGKFCSIIARKQYDFS